MGEGNSPYFAAGLADGERDAGLVMACPPWPPLGPDPDRVWSWMYKRGYDRGFGDAVPHSCPRCNPALRAVNSQIIPANGR